MHLHTSSLNNEIFGMFLDDQERISVLPTDFVNSLSRSARNFSDGTIATYAGKLKAFLETLELDELYPPEFSIDDRIRSLDLVVVDNYLKSLQLLGRSPATIRLTDVVIKRFTDWLATDEAGRSRDTPLYQDGKYRSAAPPKRMPRYLTLPQVIELSLGLNFEFQRLTTQLMFDVAARVSEVPRIRYLDLPKLEHYPKTQNYFPLLIRGSKGRGKRLKQRYSIISRPVLIRLAKYHKSKRFLAYANIKEPGQAALLNIDGKPLTKEAIQQFIRRAKVRAQLPKGHPHMLRHGTAFSILRSEHGKSFLDNLLILQKVLGHSDISTTEIYTHIPAPVLQRVRDYEGNGEMKTRFEEAQELFERTYLRSRDEPEWGRKVNV